MVRRECPARRAPLLLVLALTAAIAGARWGGPAVAEEPPIAFIRVAELNALLQRRRPVRIIDVRSHQEFLARHLPGAVSIPLDTIERHVGEIPRQGLVVLY
ncbi:MAG TPA: rhodanese-like domain-containing protein [Methylomirabilota bacterium]|jgi:hypothetical protein|nr:rhodanese-like domain-containing protein [Methylomirabilota bacterium]